MVNAKDPLALQFGLFARSDISNGTILCEYTGEIIREECHFDKESEYTVQLHALDKYTEAKEGPYGNAFILDAERIFNEGALVNDLRTSEEAEGTKHRRQNTEYIEVLFNGWPHLFVGCAKTTKAGEELTVDYGPAYWEKQANITKERKIREQEEELTRLRRELMNTRKSMAFQDDCD
jgi:SET domain-containing protein